MKYRSKLSIIADVLQAAGDGAKKTRIMYLANLSYRLLEKYLRIVTSANLLTCNGDKYEVTEKGRLFLQKFISYSERLLVVRKELELLKFERKVLEQMVESP